jgi:hypothetical protein
MPKRPRNKFQLNSTHAVDFSSLGLARGECNLAVIRHAVECAAVHEGQLVSSIVSGYRLMDPRKRRGLYERVQLGYVARESEEIVSEAMERMICKSLFDVQRPLRWVESKWTEKKRSLRKQIDKAVRTKKSKQKSTLDEAREVVRLIRQNVDESIVDSSATT